MVVNQDSDYPYVGIAGTGGGSVDGDGERGLLCIYKGIVHHHFGRIYPSYTESIAKASQVLEKNVDHLLLAVGGAEHFIKVPIKEEVWEEIYAEMKHLDITKRVFSWSKKFTHEWWWD